MGVVNRIANWLLLVLLVLVAVALVSTVVIGQPAVLGVIESGSMEPTLSTGDGYVPIPAVLAGDVETGDVVTFESSGIEGGQPTTHRVVEVTESGYITKGDANPVTDQDTGAPPVAAEEITAVALAVNGDVVRIPGVGVVVGLLRGGISWLQETLASLFGTDLFGGERGLALTLFGAGIALLGTEFIVERRGRSRGDRSRSRSRFDWNRIDNKLLVGGLVVLLMLVATVGMLVPAGSTTFELISAESDAETPRVTQVGGTTERPFVVENGGLLPVRVIVESESNGLTVEDERFSLSRGGVHEQTITTSAPQQTGLYRRSITEYRYFQLLPPAVIDSLHEVHPAAALLAIDLLVGVVAGSVGLLAVGTGRLRTRSRSRPRSGLTGLFDRR
ncbi:signal peptidase, endoplasmic reticulum-type [Halovenus aranensis]|uniref:Signal peptidase I n=1 Tax=Halovenus aranensis TaxID=890420 RepID=A0A1G8SK35_9EURY|nr:signal peptidase I [Halovenus aranensis]SDJ29599.1 signal peptidase, endoplasmic reticulum-type [Halovenus aranensis]